MVYLY